MKNLILAALRKNLLPGLVLQAFALTIVLIYFFVPASQSTFSIFSQLKHQYGSLYAFIATAIFGGIVPFFYLLFTRSFNATQKILPLFFFYTFFWGLKGIEVDFFYQLQGYWFGYENNFKTIAAKVSVDQFIYSALWAAPSITIPYLWVENNFSFRACLAGLNREFFFRKIPTVIFSNWLVWIPAVSIVYTMPQDLQIPLFNLVLCFWVLILAVLNKK